MVNLDLTTSKFQQQPCQPQALFISPVFLMVIENNFNFLLPRQRVVCSFLAKKINKDKAGGNTFYLVINTYTSSAFHQYLPSAIQ